MKPEANDQSQLLSTLTNSSLGVVIGANTFETLMIHVEMKRSHV